MTNATHTSPITTAPALAAAQMVTFAEAVSLLKVTKRTLRRRIAAGRYVAYGEHTGRRILLSSILADIQRESGGGSHG